MMKLPGWLVCGLTLTVAAAGGATTPGPARADEMVVSLPPMIVEGKNRPLSWRYLAGPDMELLTVCNDATAVEFVRRNHRLSELLHVLVPGKYLFRSVVPEIHILFNEDTGPARSEEVIREMVKAQGAQVTPTGTVLPGPEVEMPETRLPGIGRVKLKPQRYLFLPNMRLSDLDGQAVFAILTESGRRLNFTFTDDRVEFLLTRRAPALPDWLIEGLMGVYRRSELLVDEIRIKPLGWPVDEAPAATPKDPPRPRPLLPMTELFERRRPAGEEEADDAIRHWQAQCALFVQWTMAENHPARRAALWQFVDRLEKEPLTESLFEECFGICFSDMLVRLQAYLPMAAARNLVLDAPKGERLAGLKPRPATDLEIARIRGDWERLEIDYISRYHRDLAPKYIELARATLRRAYNRGERDPRLLASLGLTELGAGDQAAARGFLEAALAGGPVRPRAGLELARLRYAALPAEGKLSAAQVATVLEPLRHMSWDEPPLMGPYALLATVWTRSATPPGAEEMARLNEGARYFPQASAYLLRVIYFNVAGGRVAAARALAEAGWRYARDPEMRERLARVRDELAAMNP
jgi:hypothetical protein